MQVEKERRQIGNLVPMQSSSEDELASVGEVEPSQDPKLDSKTLVESLQRLQYWKPHAEEKILESFKFDLANPQSLGMQDATMSTRYSRNEKYGD